MRTASARTTARPTRYRGAARTPGGRRTARSGPTGRGPPSEPGRGTAVGVAVARAEPSHSMPSNGRQGEPHAHSGQVAERRSITTRSETRAPRRRSPRGVGGARPAPPWRSRCGGAVPCRPTAATLLDVGDLEVVEPVAPPTGRRRRHAPIARWVVVVGRRPPQRQPRPTDRDRVDRCTRRRLDRPRSPPIAGAGSVPPSPPARRRRSAPSHPGGAHAGGCPSLARTSIVIVCRPSRPAAGHRVGHVDRRPRPDRRQLERPRATTRPSPSRPARLEVVDPVNHAGSRS